MDRNEDDGNKSSGRIHFGQKESYPWMQGNEVLSCLNRQPEKTATAAQDNERAIDRLVRRAVVYLGGDITDCVISLIHSR